MPAAGIGPRWARRRITSRSGLPTTFDGRSCSGQVVEETLLASIIQDSFESRPALPRKHAQKESVLSLGPVLPPPYSSQHPDESKDMQLQDLMHWHQANAEFANAASLKVSAYHGPPWPYISLRPYGFFGRKRHCPLDPQALSLSHWDQDDLWEMIGPHVFLPGKILPGLDPCHSLSHSLS